jgi:hypothetical protein
MVSCPRCGANIDPSAPACPYCQTQTLYGKQQAERHAAYQYQAAQADHAQKAADRQVRQQALSKKAKHAMWWSLAGTVTCCFPLAIIGLVMGLNVKGVAKREGAVAPGTATVAVVLGFFALGLFCLVVVLGVMADRENKARIEVLRAQVDAGQASELLAQPIACALTELELRQEGFDDKSGVNIQAFQCDGKLEQERDRAILEDVRFKIGSGAGDKRVVAACLVRGARWTVKELRSDGSCGPRAVAAPSSRAARP